jgi:3-oxoacyl-[acyl-carrier protein] reductase
MSERPLKDRVAIVTGGASGIGTGICMRLADKGAKVAIFDVMLDGAKKVAEEIVKLGGTALAFKVDVSRASEVDKSVKEVISKLGKVDILVNDAGVTNASEVANMSEEIWDKVNGINLKGVFLCCRAVVPFLKERKYGKIVNIASYLAPRGCPYYAHYGATKAGVVAFTQGLALELGPHKINVNAVGPGYIDTPMSRHDMTPETKKLFEEKKIPMRRIGTPLDIANAVLFLVSEEASYITGQCIYVCGGLTADAGLL